VVFPLFKKIQVEQKKAAGKVHATDPPKVSSLKKSSILFSEASNQPLLYNNYNLLRFVVFLKRPFTYDQELTIS